MRFVHFLEYDISEGLVRFWKRYLWVIVLVFLTCLLFDRETALYLEMYGESWSPLGYGLKEFFGQRPYHFTPNDPQRFEIPFSWLLQYVLLAYCMGNYVAEDMRGFGMHMMTKSKSRGLWWISKSVCCICINLFYFLLLYGMTAAYTWFVTGNMQMKGQEMALSLYFGDAVAYTSVKELLQMTVLLPVLTGIVQSFIQMLLSLYVSSAVGMGVITFLLVVSSYYGNRYLIHGYAMVCRYFRDDIHPEDVVLTTQFGLVYLTVWIAGLVITGYVLVRKRDIL